MLADSLFFYFNLQVSDAAFLSALFSSFPLFALFGKLNLDELLVGFPAVERLSQAIHST